MKPSFFVLFATIVFLCYPEYAWSQKPPVFSRDSVKESFDGKWIIVRYGKSSLNGRKIFGSVVPYYKVWRTGAGAATELETEIDLEMNGAIIPRGKYSLYSLPTENLWKLIINKQTGQWGTVYNKSQDLVRLPLKIQTLPHTIEKFTLRIDRTEKTRGRLILQWERTEASIPIEVP